MLCSICSNGLGCSSQSCCCPIYVGQASGSLCSAGRASGSLCSAGKTGMALAAAGTCRKLVPCACSKRAACCCRSCQLGSDAQDSWQAKKLDRLCAG